MSRSTIVVALLAVASLSCNDSTKPHILTKARFLNGATPAADGTVNLTAIKPVTVAPASVVPQNGYWLMSPDQVGLTVKRIQLTGGASNGTDVDCSVVFSRSQAGLSPLNDCQISVEPGTYTGINIVFSAIYSVLINDPVNGFYTTSSGIQTTLPAGGVTGLVVSHTGSSVVGDQVSVAIRFPTAAVITDTSTVAANIVVDGLQFLRTTVSNGAVTLGSTGISSDPFFPDVVASVGTPAKVALYSQAALGTAGSFCSGCGTSPASGITAVNVYYSSPSSVAMVGMNLSGTPASCSPIGASFVNDARGYVGRDAAGNIGWAVPTTNTWATYASVLRMAEVTTVGAATTLYCKTQSTDPAPSGGSFASGAPNIAVAGNSLGTYVLVAK